MVKRIIAGAILIGIASTLLFCTSPLGSAQDKQPGPQNGPCPDCKTRGSGGMMMPPQSQGRFVTPQDEMGLPKLDEETEKLLKELDPERLERLKHLRQVDPPAYMKLFEETQRERMKLRELKERDPQRYEQVIQERRMETEIKGLAMQCRKSQDNAEKEELKKQIKVRLEKLFDLRETQRETEIKRLEEQLTKLKEKMKTRKANRDKIIERRGKELIGEEDDMGW
ncbi:MAG: hypothetical protein HZA49_10415 [Planctomycetes bacterium]|nr:hypothetical protein [Planctomycetota bacterium]